MSACANAAAPLVLPLQNYTVSADSLVQVYGVQLGIGTPQQPIVFSLSSSDSYDVLIPSAYCGSASNDSCIGKSGGVFDSSKSSTYTSTIQSQWNGTGPVTSQGSFFNDKLSFGTSDTVYGYPLFLDYGGYGASASFGLSPTCTFLNATVEAGAAPSKDYGLWTGSRSTWNPQAGSLIIGGYDSTRRKGETHTYASRLNCGTCVDVSNMTYVAPNGTIFNLFGSNQSTFTANLDAYFEYMSTPQDVYDLFAAATDAIWDEYLGYVWPVSAAPKGTLRITLDDGYVSNIPWTEFIDFQRDFSGGPYSIRNYSVVETYLFNNSNPKYALNWGVPFLSSNYIFAQYGSAKFDLSPVTINNDAVSATKICSGTGSMPNETTTGNGTSPTGGASPKNGTSPAVPSTSGGSKSHAGAIAGGVVGGVLGLALIALAVWFFFIRKRKQKPAANATTHGTPAHVEGAYGPNPAYEKHGDPVPYAAAAGYSPRSPQSQSDTRYSELYAQPDGTTYSPSSPSAVGPHSPPMEVEGSRLPMQHNINGPLELPAEYEDRSELASTTAVGTHGSGSNI